MRLGTTGGITEPSSRWGSECGSPRSDETDPSRRSAELTVPLLYNPRIDAAASETYLNRLLLGVRKRGMP
jgi:hypothetical protein